MAISDGPVAFWGELGAARVHPADSAFLGRGKFETSLLPQPWVGPLKLADIFILQLNPGLDGAEIAFETSRADFREALSSNLSGTAENLFLDARFQGHPGAKWVRRILGANATPSAGSRVCMVELVPYHSVSGSVARAASAYLPSSAMIRSWVHRELVPRAMDGEILLIAPRSAALWGFDYGKTANGIIAYTRGQARSASLTPQTLGGVSISARLGIHHGPEQARFERPALTSARSKEARTPPTMRNSEEDTDAAALSGQLGRCGAQIKDLFLALDRGLAGAGLSISRSMLARGGSWLGRTYKVDNRKILEVHPKGDWLKVFVGPQNMAFAPKELVPVGESRDGWIIIEPRTSSVGFRFAIEAAQRNAK